MADLQQVHHETYENTGNEPLEDLVGLCRPCHEFISAKTTIDPATNGIRVYLAGPITGTRWRDELLVGDRDVFPSQTREGTDKNGLPAEHDRKSWWPIAPRGLRDGFDFTGPWFEDITGGHGCPPEDPHGWVAIDRTKDCIGSPGYVAIACRGSIEASDVVFCWIPAGCSPYGTVWELGYAAALGKIIVVYEQTENNNDRWLAGTNADVWGYAETPVLAWGLFLREWRESRLPQEILWTRELAKHRAKLLRYQ
jgi:hypothetical protein